MALPRDRRVQIRESIEPWVIFLCAGLIFVLTTLALAPSFPPRPGGGFELDSLLLGIGELFTQPIGRAVAPFATITGTLTGVGILAVFQSLNKRHRRGRQALINLQGDAKLGGCDAETLALDRYERNLARLEPDIVVTFTGLIVQLSMLLFVFFPDVGPRPNWLHVLIVLFLAILGVFALNRMSRSLALLASLAPLVVLLTSSTQAPALILFWDRLAEVNQLD